jgi:hypothetical protein
MIKGIILHGYRLGYEGPATRIISYNLDTVNLDLEAMTQMLIDDLQLGKVRQTLGESPFICSPLGFVTKSNGKLRRIYYLFFPYKTSTNSGINN